MSTSEEEEVLLFEELTFYIDSDVNEEVKEAVQKEGGKIVADLPSEQQPEWIWLVNQKYVRVLKDDADKPRVCRVVLQSWVNTCMMKKRVVDSTATAPEVTPRSFSAPTSRAKGLSCSFQGRTSPPT